MPEWLEWSLVGLIVAGALLFLFEQWTGYFAKRLEKHRPDVPSSKLVRKRPKK